MNKTEKKLRELIRETAQLDVNPRRWTLENGIRAEIEVDGAGPSLTLQIPPHGPWTLYSDDSLLIRSTIEQAEALPFPPSNEALGKIMGLSPEEEAAREELEDNRWS